MLTRAGALQLCDPRARAGRFISLVMSVSSFGAPAAALLAEGGGQAMMRLHLSELDPTTMVPLTTRLRACEALDSALTARSAAEAGEFEELLDWKEEALPLLTALVHALVLDASKDDELSDALTELIKRALALSPTISSTAAAVLGIAEVDILQHQASAAGLVGLLALMLDPDMGPLAIATANTLPEHRALISFLLHKMEADTGTAGDAALTGQLATCLMLRMMQANGASASSVLSRCDIRASQLLALLPGVTRLPRPPLTDELLELLEVLATDAALAPDMLTPAVLAALKPPLLSGHMHLQLACIHLLLTLHATAGPTAADAFVKADLAAFAIELCRRDAGSAQTHQREQPSLLRHATRQLLYLLLAAPQLHPGMLLVRLLDALEARSPPRTNAIAAKGVECPSQADRWDHWPPTNAIAATLSDDAHVLSSLEAACVSQLLQWHRPIAPRETQRLASYVTSTAAPLFDLAALQAATDVSRAAQRGRTPRSQGGPQPSTLTGAACSPGDPDSEPCDSAIEGDTCATAARLLHVSVQACTEAADTAAIDALAHFTSSSTLQRLLILASDHGAPVVSDAARIDLACALSGLLSADGATGRRPLAIASTTSALALTRALTADASPSSIAIESNEAASRLAASILTALGRLVPSQVSAALPARLDVCMQQLAACASACVAHRHDGMAYLDGSEGGQSWAGDRVVVHSSYVAHIEWLLLHLQQCAGVSPCGAAADDDHPHAKSIPACSQPIGQGAEYSYARPVPNDCNERACLHALARYVMRHAAALHTLPPGTVRRLATVVAQFAPQHAPESQTQSSLEMHCELPSDLTGLLESAGTALVQVVLQLSAAHAVVLPPHLMRWVLLKAAPARAASAMLEWMLVPLIDVQAQQAQPGGTKCCSLDGATPLALACYGSPAMAAILVRLLTTDLHLTLSKGGLRATLALIDACIESDHGVEIGCSTAHAAFASAGLSCALSQLGTLLPSNETEPEMAQDAPRSSATSAQAELHLVLRLMGSQMRYAAACWQLPVLRASSEPSVAEDADTEEGNTQASGHQSASRQGFSCRVTAAEACTVAQHALRALACEATSAPAAGSALQLESCNFLNTAMALFPEVSSVITSHEASVMAVVQLALSTGSECAVGASDGWADLTGPFKNALPAAASLLLVQMLRRSDVAASAQHGCGKVRRLLATPSCRRFTTVLRAQIGLSGLLREVRSRASLRSASALHLASELCLAGVLSPQACAPSQAPPGRQNTPSLRPTSCVGTEIEAWKNGLACTLLNTCLRPEKEVLNGVCHLAMALRASTPATAACFATVARHPWQRVALETTIMHRPQLPAALCSYWSLVLEQRPSWIDELVTRKPALVRELVLKLIEGSELGIAEVGLLGALRAAVAMSAALCSEARKLLQLRIREPTAARWGALRDGADACVPGIGNDAAPCSQRAGMPRTVLQADDRMPGQEMAAMSVVDGAVVVVGLLHTVPPLPIGSHTMQCTDTKLARMDLLRKAERLFRPASFEGMAKAGRPLTAADATQHTQASPSDRDHHGHHGVSI